MQRILATTKGEGQVTHHIAAALSGGATGKFNFISCGDKHICYWMLDGRNLSSSKVTTSAYKPEKGLPKCGDAKAFLCAIQVKSVVRKIFVD